MKSQQPSRHVAWNTHLLFVLLLLCIMLLMAVTFISEGEIGFSVFCFFIVLLSLFVFFTSPLYIVFTDEYVEIVYHFGQRLTVRWSEIRKIYLQGSWFSRGGGTLHYVLVYPQREKRLFFVNGEIPKTGATKKWLSHYHQGEIN